MFVLDENYVGRWATEGYVDATLVEIFVGFDEGVCDAILHIYLLKYFYVFNHS